MGFRCGCRTNKYKYWALIRRLWLHPSGSWAHKNAYEALINKNLAFGSACEALISAIQAFRNAYEVLSSTIVAFRSACWALLSTIQALRNGCCVGDFRGYSAYISLT